VVPLSESIWGVTTCSLRSLRHATFIDRHRPRVILATLGATVTNCVHSLRLLDLRLFLLAGMVACGDSSQSAGTGSVRVTTATTGVDPDANGYVVTIEGTSAQPIGSSGTASVSGIAAGTRTLLLGDMASNCTVLGENPRVVAVVADGTTDVTISIDCAPLPGTVSVTTTTDGQDLDPDGYVVVVGGQNQRIGINSTATVPGVPSGSYGLALTDVRVNCTVAGDSVRQVELSGGGSASVALSVSCAGPASHDIVFASQREGDFDIWRMNANGTRLINLTADLNSELESDPAWSPDGSQIAFRAGPDIFVMNADGTGRRRVADESPDGSQLLYVNAGGASVANADGSGVSLLLLKPSGICAMREPSWSPVGDRLAMYTSICGFVDAPIISVFDRAGLSLYEFQGREPAWSLDGTKLAYIFAQNFGQGETNVVVREADRMAVRDSSISGRSMSTGRG
jgi:hypothetical protein